jgi:hypothetical protein
VEAVSAAIIAAPVAIRLHHHPASFETRLTALLRMR